MQVRAIKNHYVVKPQSLTQFAEVFPDFKHANVQGEDFCAVPMTIDHARVLLNLGYATPPPMYHAYDWPGRFTPYPHQMHTAGFLTMNPRAFVLNGMGTMKTLSTLWAADYLMKAGIIRKALVLSPLSTLERVWGDEIFNNFPQRTFAVLHGNRDKRLKLWKENYDFYILNHDGLKVLKDVLDERSDIDLLIIDEVAVFRNAQTGKWKMVKELCKDANRWVWGLTGTPTPNAPTDAYGQVKLIKPENYQGHFTRFKNTVMQQISSFSWVPRKGAEQIVNKIMSPSIRYALEDCVDLPETIRQERSCELSKEQQRHYDKLKQQALTEIEDQVVTAANAAVLASKLLQASCGVMYSGEGESVEVDFGPRLAVLEECIEESTDKVLVFVPFTGVLKVLKEKLKGKHHIEIVDGSTSTSKRNHIFRDFQENPNGVQVILANPETMAHGLTLTAATTIIWYAPTYKNEIYEQANARIARPGQKKITNIVNLSATPLERRVYKKLQEKGKLQAVILDMAKNSL